MLSTQTNTSPRISNMSIREHFQQTISRAMERQNVRADALTVYYLVNLLEQYVQSGKLFSPTEDGLRIPALAILYSKALEAREMEKRHQLLQRLGDLALLMSGLFPGNFPRKLVGVDYYIGMGGSAYSYLSDTAHRSKRTRPFKEAYADLSTRFPIFVDILTDVADDSRLNPPSDILSLYDNWMKSGSSRSINKLRELGIEPISGGIQFRA